MPRNIVICCDGTNNQFGPENTNVVRLVQVVEHDAQAQLVYYDPGVGTLPEPGLWNRLAARISILWGLAFGAGLERNVEEAYSFLMDFYEPGDRVFLFGFSRGAYTARVLAGLLHQLGLLPRGSYNLVPYVLRLFKGIRRMGPPAPGPAALANGGGPSKPGVRPARGSTAWYWKLCDDFRWTFARQVPGGGDQRRFPVHFLGAWDTVSSVGWVWDPKKYLFTLHNPSIAAVRHAVAVDERRAFFRQNLMEKASDVQDFKQMWFAGVHADVGGGYPEADGGLWRVAFQWMLNEARNHGLHVNEDRLARVLNNTPPPAKPWNEPKHESLTPAWWLAEFFPKLRKRGGWPFRLPTFNAGRPRIIKNGAWIHHAALQRLREPAAAGTCAYHPPNMSPKFVQAVRDLPQVPDYVEYHG